MASIVKLDSRTTMKRKEVPLAPIQPKLSKKTKTVLNKLYQIKKISNVTQLTMKDLAKYTMETKTINTSKYLANAPLETMNRKDIAHPS